MRFLIDPESLEVVADSDQSGIAGPWVVAPGTPVAVPVQLDQRHLDRLAPLQRGWPQERPAERGKLVWRPQHPERGVDLTCRLAVLSTHEEDSAIEDEQDRIRVAREVVEQIEVPGQLFAAWLFFVLVQPYPVVAVDAQANRGGQVSLVARPLQFDPLYAQPRPFESADNRL